MSAEPLLIPLGEVLPQIPLNQSTAYRLIERDEFPLPLVRIGRRWFVRHADLQALFVPNESRPLPDYDACREHRQVPSGIHPGDWGHVHNLAHARVPFTRTAFVEIADCPLGRTRRVVGEAFDRGWLKSYRPLNEIPRWIGCLP